MGMRALLAILFLMTVGATACGDSPGESATSATSRTGASISEARSGAERLITRLGSAEVALDAVIRALDRGYETDQILSAIDEDRLAADGTIIGVEPGFARGFLAESSVGEGAAPSLVTVNGAEAELTAISSAAQQNPTLDIIRFIARKNAELYGVGDDDHAALEFLLTAGRNGYSASELTEMLVAGIDEVITEEDCIGVRIGQEVLFANPEGDCEIAPGRYPASQLATADAQTTPKPTDDAPAGPATTSEPIGEEEVVYGFVFETDLAAGGTVDTNEVLLEVRANEVTRLDGAVTTSETVTWEADDFNPAGSCVASVTVAYEFGASVPIEPDGTFSGEAAGSMIGSGDCFVDGSTTVFQGVLRFSGRILGIDSAELSVEVPYTADGENYSPVLTELLPED